MELEGLRGMVRRGDGSAVVDLLRRRGAIPPDALQLIGDGLLAALAQRVDGAAPLASRCAEALRRRRWTGDETLAGYIEATVGTAAIPMLRPLHVNLDALADLLEGDPVEGGGCIDLLTGEIWHKSALEYDDDQDEEEDDDEETDRWLWVDSEGSSDRYHDMKAFVDTVAERETAERLEAALRSQAAFLRFTDALNRWPDELERWHAFSDDRRRGRARAWLAAVGYRS